MILRILFNLGLDISYKQSRFFEVLLKKSLKFVLNKKSGLVTLNFDLILLLVKVDPILEKQSYKRDALLACSISYIKMILVLSKKVVSLYI